nr:NADH dehydrogenase subunit 6 [Spirocerca lupi]
MVFFLFFSVFISLLCFCLCFLDGEPLKSCVLFCLGVLFMSIFISLGIHVWYSYFMVLIFLSGVLSLLTYVCGLVNYNLYYNYVFFGVLFFFIFFWYFFFGGVFYFDFFSDFNFLLLYYDINYLFVFWLVIILILLLNFISFNLNGSCCLRGL